MTSLKKTGRLIQTQITHKYIFIMRNNKKRYWLLPPVSDTERQPWEVGLHSSSSSLCNFLGMGMADTELQIT